MIHQSKLNSKLRIMKRILILIGLALLTMNCTAQKLSEMVANGDTLPDVTANTWFLVSEIADGTKTSYAVRLQPIFLKQSEYSSDTDSSFHLMQIHQITELYADSGVNIEGVLIEGGSMKLATGTGGIVFDENTYIRSVGENYMEIFNGTQTMLFTIGEVLLNKRLRPSNNLKNVDLGTLSTFFGEFFVDSITLDTAGVAIGVVGTGSDKQFVFKDHKNGETTMESMISGSSGTTGSAGDFFPSKDDIRSIFNAEMGRGVTGDESYFEDGMTIGSFWFQAPGDTLVPDTLRAWTLYGDTCSGTVQGYIGDVYGLATDSFFNAPVAVNCNGSGTTISTFRMNKIPSSKLCWFVWTFVIKPEKLLFGGEAHLLNGE